MSSYLIKGGNKLRGSVDISGSKNAALGVIAAAMLVDGECLLENVPEIRDIEVMLQICASAGAQVERVVQNNVQAIRIDARNLHPDCNLSDSTRQIRASYYLLGALLGKLHAVRMKMPGGCNFGSRPMDQHYKGFAALGAQVETKQGDILLRAGQEGLTGAHIMLDVVSVGATINLMIAACKARGRTFIQNAAKEPHIVDVANFLNAMGAKIIGAGTDIIRVDGVETLPGGKTYSVIPDQIEAGTYMIAAAVTRGDVVVRNIIPRHMEPLTIKLKAMGITTDIGPDYCRICADEDLEIKPATFKTTPYPGFPTDLQPQTTVLLTQAKGKSCMIESVWATRYQYIGDLITMGASIEVQGSYANVTGPSALSATRVVARDLRAGAAMVIAALAAEGETQVEDAEVVKRGYERLEEKLSALGASIRLVP